MMIIQLRLVVCRACSSSCMHAVGSRLLTKTLTKDPAAGGTKRKTNDAEERKRAEEVVVAVGHAIDVFFFVSGSLWSTMRSCGRRPVPYLAARPWTSLASQAAQAAAARALLDRAAQEKSRCRRRPSLLCCHHRLGKGAPHQSHAQPRAAPAQTHPAHPRPRPAPPQAPLPPPHPGRRRPATRHPAGVPPPHWRTPFCGPGCRSSGAPAARVEGAGNPPRSKDEPQPTGLRHSRGGAAAGGCGGGGVTRPRLVGACHVEAPPEVVPRRTLRPIVRQVCDAQRLRRASQWFHKGATRVPFTRCAAQRGGRRGGRFCLHAVRGSEHNRLRRAAVAGRLEGGSQLRQLGGLHKKKGKEGERLGPLGCGAGLGGVTRQVQPNPAQPRLAQTSPAQPSPAQPSLPVRPPS